MKASECANNGREGQRSKNTILLKACCNLEIRYQNLRNWKLLSYEETKIEMHWRRCFPAAPLARVPIYNQ